MCLGTVTYASSLGVLACCVDGVNDGLGENNVANDGFVIEYPNVDDALPVVSYGSNVFFCL